MIRIQTKSYYKLWGAYTYITGDIYKSTKFYQQKPVFTIDTVIYDVSLGKNIYRIAYIFTCPSNLLRWPINYCALDLIVVVVINEVCY